MAELSLLQKQFIFCALSARLIDKAREMGYNCKYGETLRSKEEAARLAKLGKGIKTSLHISSLAVDLLLFRNGIYLTETESYRQLGTWWEMQDAGKNFECHWGGHFGDGNHFSIGHLGRK